MAYVSVTVEGGLFPSDLLDRIATGDVEGQRAADFGIDGRRRLADEIQSAFSDARSFWDAFQRRLQRSRESKTTLTREDWMIPFLELLGFEQLIVQRSSAEAGGEQFFISHRAGEDPTAPPVHIVALDEELDRRSGTGRRSPHAAVQEYLNRSDALWGITTNGGRLRLLRNTERLTKPTYLEFDLDGMVESNQYGEFVLLYRLMHASRFPLDGAAPHECLLERYYQQGIDEGGRVRDKLREGVEEALRVLGTAFLSHPGSRELRDRVASGALDAQGYYRQLLRLVYRFLFLMVAEERRLIFPPGEEEPAGHAVYQKYYSVSRLRERCERYFADDANGDLWLSLSETFRLFRDNEAAKKLGLSALDGQLFNDSVCADLEGAACSNEHLLTALRHLSTFVDEGPGRRRRRVSGQRRRVNYAGLDVEEFGSVYESLLDFQPMVTLDPPAFDLITGSERKQTGSYYTPPGLVRELIESALVPVVEERLAKAKGKEEKEAALLGMRVCDPASGSGHFLLAAARRIARELGKARSGEEEPTPEAYREAVRDVIRHCVYAVDKNPLAVDLCKVALWIEGHNAGLPLSFLDHQVKCGDSLVGVFDLDVLTKGIPDDAYKPVTGDDKKAASYFRKRNKAEREGSPHMDSVLAFAQAEEASARLAPEFAALSVEPERTPEDIHAKEELYAELHGQSGRWWTYKVACDLWTAAFFTPLRSTDGADAELVPTTGTLRRFLAQPDAANGQIVGQAVGLSQAHRFFHWPLEFPEIFTAGGFDAVLGNPPWEMVEFSERDFFANEAPEISDAPTARQRRALIERMKERDPSSHARYMEARHSLDAYRCFMQASERFPTASSGRINSYPLFVEAFAGRLAPASRLGMIVPSAISLDAYNAPLFSWLVESGRLLTFLDFENRDGIFPALHRSYRFCLLTTGPARTHSRMYEFLYFCHDVADLREDQRRIRLQETDIAGFSPNTLSPPILLNATDLRLARTAYSHCGVLKSKHRLDINGWKVSVQRMLSLSDPGDLFRKANELGGGRAAAATDEWTRLYSGKTIHQFNHRFASWDGKTWHELPDPELANPAKEVDTEYYVRSSAVEKRVRGKNPRRWLIGYRDVCRATDERTSIAAVIPSVGCDTHCRNVYSSLPAEKLTCLLANFNSFVLDYFCRQKVISTGLGAGILEQLPFLPPTAYERGLQFFGSETPQGWVRERVLELTYTASDLRSFAEDLSYHGPPFRWDEERRFLLRCELDAAYFHLYGIERDDVGYIMETFPIVKRNDEKRFGEYRTKRLILQIYDATADAAARSEPYRTLLDPPPADPRMAHPAINEAV